MTRALDQRLEVAREITAAPSVIFGVLTSPAGHVLIDSSGMLQSAEGVPVAGVDDTFVVHMDRESLGDLPMGRYDVIVTITRFARDREIEWSVSDGVHRPIGHRYGYLLEPTAPGSSPSRTRVVAYYDWSQVPERHQHRFPVIPESALRATLGILARVVQQQPV